MTEDYITQLANLLQGKRSRVDLQERNLEIVPFKDMLEPDLQQRALIKGVLTKNAIALMLGPAGSRKTFLALDLSLHVSAGLQWFGRRTEPASVVYIAAEAGRSIRNRVAAWAQEMLPDRDLFNEGANEIRFRAVVSPVDLCHLDSGDVDKLIEAIGSADLIIIDTVSRALAGGNENGPEDMGSFVTALDMIRAQLDCTVLAVHHIGKDASKGGRGHSLLHCAVDAEIEVDSRDEIVSVATLTKQRDGPAGVEIAFKLRQVELGVDEYGDPVTSCVVEAADYVPAAKKKDRVQGQLRQALEVLGQAISENGEARQVDGGRTVYAVKIDTWRDCMERSALFGDAARFRNAWSRAKNKLGDLGEVEYGDGYVWVAGVPM